MKAAVYLNNTGVSLLQKGSYRQAQETLADAAEVMTKMMASSTAGTSSGDDKNTTISTMLKTAAKRMARPQEASCIESVNVKVISDGCHPHVLFEQISSSLTTTAAEELHHVVAFKVEHADFDNDAFGDRDGAVMRSLVFYNAAMALRCVARELAGSGPGTPPSNNAASAAGLMVKCNLSAYRLLHRAYMTINSAMKRPRPTSSSSTDDDNKADVNADDGAVLLRHFDRPHVEVMVMEVLRNLVALSRELGMTSQHYQYRTRSSRQRGVVEALRSAKRSRHHLSSLSAASAA